MSDSEASASTDKLGTPAQPLRYYCNKCGHMGEQGPEHDVCAGFPQQRCNYSATAWGPFWSTEQLDAVVAAERERLRVLVEAVRDANFDAEDGNTFQLLKPGQERAWLALLAGLKGPNVRANTPTEAQGE